MDEVKDRPPEVASEVVDPAPTGTAVSALDPLTKIKAGLVTLAAERQAWDLTTAAGDKAARAFRAKCVGLRTAVTEAYEVVNRPMLETQRKARELVKDIEAAVKLLEEPTDKAIKAREVEVEAAREVKRQAAAAEERKKAEAERQRIEAIQARIDEIRRAGTGHGKADAHTLAEAMAAVEALPLTEEVYAEYLTAARRAHGETLAVLQDLHDGAAHREAEAKRLAAERAELARQQEEAAALSRRMQAEEEQRQAAARAEQARLDAEAAEARRIADERAAAERAEADRIAAEARAAEEARLAEQRAAQAAEQARLDAERQAREAVELAERQAREAAEKAERDRLEAERLEAERIAKAQREAAEKMERDRLIAEAAARTRLQAAAQDMLDALKQWRWAETTDDSVKLQNARDARDAAIALAEGEPA